MTLRCRKTGGQLPASVPRAVRSSTVGEQFAALLEHLDGHEKECRATVESWMLNGCRCLPGSSPGCGPPPGGGPACGTWWFRVEGRAGLLEEVSEHGRVSVRTANGRRFRRHQALGPGERRVSPDGHRFHDGRDFWWHPGTTTGSRRASAR
ncbi:hypothetical protein [Nonomuraea sp. NPDC050691]|uniref:hypothetical protein n=1 Tax=Nonomuraea sp. NPDC050691 TaxID=3155661 RepID=UPI0033E0FD40